jgi:hypothetical protein
MAKQEGKAQLVAWQYLTEEEREEYRTRVRAWLNQPDRESSHKIVLYLSELAVDKLVYYAFGRFYERQRETGAPKTHQGEVWERHLEKAEVEAAASTRVCCDELRALAALDKEATREVLDGTMKWWVKERKTGQSGDLDLLLERCADQLAAVLVFKNLPPAEDMNHKISWDVLLHRVVQRIILPRLGGPSSKDSVNDCILAILERAEKFDYQGLGQAIEFFTEAYRLKILRGPPQLDTEPIPEPEPKEDEESRPVRLPSSLIVPSILEQIIERHEDELTRQLRREKLWSIRKEVDQEVVLRFWILFILKEDRQRSWDEIAGLVLQPRCGILSDDDLPPDVSWGEVQGAFQTMAQRSRAIPDKLTSAALRKFYSRTI